MRLNKGKKYPKIILKKKAMTEKYADQYVDELEIYFPEIEKKELRRMVKSLTGELSSYMSMVQRVHHTVKKSFLENGRIGLSC
jgi:hypothetical protein